MLVVLISSCCPSCRRWRFKVEVSSSMVSNLGVSTVSPSSISSIWVRCLAGLGDTSSVIGLLSDCQHMHPCSPPVSILGSFQAEQQCCSRQVKRETQGQEKALGVQHLQVSLPHGLESELLFVMTQLALSTQVKARQVNRHK